MVTDILVENLNPERCRILCVVIVLCVRDLGLDPPPPLLVPS